MQNALRRIKMNILGKKHFQYEGAFYFSGD